MTAQPLTAPPLEFRDSQLDSQLNSGDSRQDLLPPPDLPERRPATTSRTGAGAPPPRSGSKAPRPAAAAARPRSAAAKPVAHRGAAPAFNLAGSRLGGLISVLAICIGLASLAAWATFRQAWTETHEAERSARFAAGHVSAIAGMGLSHPGPAVARELRTARNALTGAKERLQQERQSINPISLLLTSALEARRQSLALTVTGLLDSALQAQSAVEALSQIPSSTEQSVSTLAPVQTYLASVIRSAEGVSRFPPLEPAPIWPLVIMIAIIVLGILALWTGYVARTQQWQRLLHEAQMAQRQMQQERESNEAALMMVMDDLLPLSAGNLYHRLTVGQDITGSLADRMNLVADSTQHAIESVKKACAQTITPVGEVASLASAIYTAARSVSLEAAGCRDGSNRALAAVTRGRALVGEAGTLIQNASTQTKRLGEAANAAAALVDLIGGISDKVHILALNARLTSSQSQSDHGGPFAAIATELLALSNDTSSAVKRITDHIRAMSSEASLVLQSTESATSQVVSAAPLWDEAVERLRSIAATADNLDQLMATQRDATERQNAAASTASDVLEHLQASVAHFRTEPT